MKGEQDLICAKLQEQLLREGSSDFLMLFRDQKETDLMRLAAFIKAKGE